MHTKNVYSLLDLPSGDEAHKKLTKHLENCTACEWEFQQYKKANENLKLLIPEVVMDKDLHQTFNSEIVELFHTMELSNRVVLKKKVKNKIIFIDQMGIDFFKNLTSKKMIKFYFIGAALCLGLKHII